MRIWSEQSRLNLFRDSLCGQILRYTPVCNYSKVFSLFFLSFLIFVFGYLFKFLSLRERLSFDFRCKSTTSNSQNLGVKSKKCKKSSFFFTFLYFEPIFSSYPYLFSRSTRERTKILFFDSFLASARFFSLRLLLGYNMTCINFTHTSPACINFPPPIWLV